MNPINTHIHLFNKEDLPKNLFCGLISFFAGKHKALDWLLHNLIPGNKDKLDYYLNIINEGKNSEFEKFYDCQLNYPEDFKFITLTMDMAFMGAGKVKRDYSRQLTALSSLAELEKPRIFPFIHIDPRRKDIYQLFIEAVTQLNYRGIKLYPPLGIFPYDERLLSIYDYCEKANIPIIAHCSPYNPIHFQGTDKELEKLLSQAKPPYLSDFATHGLKRKELCSQFTNPLNYERLLIKYPKLRFNLAHFGSEYFWNKYLENQNDQKNWVNIIITLMTKYKNCYTDLSYTFHNQKFFPILNDMLDNPEINGQILFGTDFYMNMVEGTEKDFVNNLRWFLRQKKWELLSKINTNKFIYG